MTFSLPQQLAPLKAFNNWVAFSKQWNEQRGKHIKLPLNPHTGLAAEQNNSDTWGAFDEAYSLALENSRKMGMQIGDFYGVGFEFGLEPCGIAGIDLDHVINDKGELANWAREVVELMDSYTEYSPSGKGLHILFKVDESSEALHQFFGGQWGKNNQKKGIEIYVARHYFTITGNVYGSPRAIRTATDEMKKVYRKYFTDTDRQSSIADWKYNPDNYTSSPVEAQKPSNSELWQKMFNATNGARIHALFNGDISGYPSQSEADQALCNDLAYWTNGDAVQMDSMFRETALMRDKWDEIHSGSQTYGEATIAKAIRDTSTYEAGQSNSNARNQKQSASTGEERGRTRHDLLHYLQHSFQGDTTRFNSYRDCKSGYSNIDHFNSLYPGLYFVGGVSGSGKTTFLHQMADQIAQSGGFVLYFSLEQSQFELVSKGIARLTAQRDHVTACTALEIRNGKDTDAVQQAIGAYEEFADHEVIIECDFNTSIDSITADIQDYIGRTGRRPVVFIDYLQIIQPSPSSNSKGTKEAVDEVVHALKKVQVDNALVMFVISSFNRQNYMTTADFESFKESGLIEYSGDVVWALQLMAMNAEMFNTEGKIQNKRKFIHEEREKSPRKVELISLKNRYGRSFVRYFFTYDAKHDLFTPYDITEAEADEEVQKAFNAFCDKHGIKNKENSGGKGNKTRSDML